MTCDPMIRHSIVQRQHARAIAEARRLVVDPAAIADRPLLRRMCWHVLRGWPVAVPGPEAIAFRVAREARRIRKEG